MSIQSENRITNLISVAGVPTCDIAYYMARLLNTAGFRCLVIDNSKRKDLFRCIRKADETITIAQTGEIYYMENVAYSEEYFAMFDYVVIYHGMMVDNELLEKSDFKYLQTDYLDITTRKIRRILEAQKEPYKFYLVYRDKVFSKIPEKLLKEEMGIKEEQIIESYEISYNEEDYMCYLGLLRNGITQIKTLSPDMKEVLQEFMKTTIPKENEKEYKLIFKNFLSGKIR